ncbi:MAG: AsmA-like C-terminal region-containing protein [Candidatus Brocadiales bacterium]|nr:AsmA-like C-terminal region-containing protein [Candidatus Brocadiales bacterium]
MRKKVQTIILQKTGGTVEYQTVDLSIFPIIHAVIHQTSISIPEKGEGTIKTLNIIPKLLPLFIGKFLIDEIQIESPDIKMVMPRSSEQSNEAKKPFNLDTFKDTVICMLYPLATELPEFQITMKDGGFNLIEEDVTVFTFGDVQAEIGCYSKEIDIKMNGTSNICEDISVIASFGQKDLKGKGEIELRHFQPQVLINRFMPNAAYRITKLIDKVSVHFKTDVPNDLQVDIDRINVSGDYDGIPFPIQINEGRVNYDGEKIGLLNVGGSFGGSSFSELTARISLGEDASIEIQSGRILVLLKELYPWVSSFEKMDKGLKDVKTVSGILQVSSLKLHGPLTMPETWSIETTGEVENLIVDTTLFPEPIEIEEGKLQAVENKVLLTDAKVNAGDSSLRISATVNHNMSELVKADIGFDGEMGKESMKWIEGLVMLSPEFHIRPPLSIPKAHLTWKKDSGISFISNLAFQDGPGISLDMFLNTEGLKINNILIQGAETNASFACGLKEDVIDFSFTGNLSHTTTDKIFLNTPFSKEWMRGDFQAHILLNQLKHSTFKGTLEGGDLSCPRIQKIPLNINDISLRADNKSVRIDSLILTWQENHLSVDGDVNISENGFLFDLAMSADGLDWDTIRKTLNIGDKEQDKNVAEEKHFWDIPVKGTLRLDAESFTFNQYTWDPVQADISFDPDCISVQVTDANFCGIFCPGVVEVTPQDISLDFQLLSHNQNLGTLIKCFGSKEGLITGKLDFEAQVMARGASEELGKLIQGDFEITAREGKYNGFGLLAKILSFLNPTEIFRGKLRDLTKKGFPYKSMVANGQIQNGILVIDAYALDAPSMGVTGHGTVDLFAKELDIELLVSPFNTADFVIKKTPIISGILGGTLVSIPIQVKGDLKSPKISYLSPSSVSKKLLNITKGVFKTPVKIIKPVIPGNGKNGSNSVNDRKKKIEKVKSGDAAL